MTKIVLVDMDGVLAGYDEGFANIWAQLYPQYPVVQPRDRKSFYLEDDYLPELSSLIEDIVIRIGFYGDLPPIPGGIEAVQLLDSLADVKVFICSAPKIPHDNCVREKYDWIRKYLGEEFTRRLILTKDKTLVRGRYLIDDKPKIKGEMKPVWEHLVFDRPYNALAPGRHINWNDFHWLVEELAS